MPVQTLEEEIQSLDHKIAQLKREYEQYFLGTRPREPALLLGDVRKLVGKLSNTPIQNTALRFRFSSLCSRYHAFKRRWEDTLRKMEAGTYDRHRFKAKIHEGSASGSAPGRSAPPAESSEELYKSYIDARRACGESVAGISREKLERLIGEQRDQLREKFGGGAEFQFRVAVEKGKVRIKARRDSS